MAHVDYDPFSTQILSDPFPVYERLRNESPVHYLEEYDAWAFSRFEDIWDAGQNPERYVSPGPQFELLYQDEEIRKLAQENVDKRLSVFSLNPPQHTQIRKQAARYFTPKAVGRLEPRLRQIVRDCLERELPKGRFCAIRDLGVQLSVRVACMIMGLPPEDGPQLAPIVRRYFRRDPNIRGFTPDTLVASTELSAYLNGIVDERRRRLEAGERFEDAIQAYFDVEIDGHRFTNEEIASHLIILVIGGTETLPNVVAGGLLALHRHPDQKRELAQDPGLVPQAFTEMARYAMPTQFLTRGVGYDHELRGQKLREGQGVMLLYRSANRDEREFSEPNRFDIHRKPPRILSFGHGTHVCLGQHAARLEGRIILEELLAAVPDFEVDEASVVPARSEFVDGFTDMPLVFEPRELQS